MCQDCDHKDFLFDLDEMLSDSDYEWASDIIEGIRDTVKFKYHVTQRQSDAIDNIRNAVEERRR